MRNNEKREIILEKIRTGTWNEKEILSSCKTGLISSKDLPDKLKNDKEFAIQYAKQVVNYLGGKDSLCYFLEEIRSDKTVVFLFLKNCYRDSLKYASLEIQKDRDFLLSLAENDIPIGYINKGVFRSKKFAIDFLNAISQKNRVPNLDMFPKKLREDKEFLSLYFEKNVNVNYQLEHIPGSVWNDVAFMKRLKCSAIDLLRYGSYEIKDDEKLVEQSCKESIYSNGFKYASERIRKDKDIVCHLYSIDKSIACDIDKELLKDKEFAKKLCDISGVVFEYLDENLRDDEEVATIAFKTYPSGIAYASDRIKQMKPIALDCFKRKMNVFSYIAPFYKGDEDFGKIMKENIQKTKTEWFAYLPESYKHDKKFVKKWLSYSYHSSSYVDLPNELKEDKELALIVTKKNPWMLSKLKPELLDDFDFALRYFLDYCRETSVENSFKEFSNRIQEDPVVVLAALNGHIPYYYEWQVDDHWGEYCIDLYEDLNSKWFQDEEFSKRIVRTFFKTKFSNGYNFEEVMKNPLSIYDILHSVAKDKDSAMKNGLYFFETDPSPSLGLNFKEDIKEMVKERERNGKKS